MPFKLPPSIYNTSQLRQLKNELTQLTSLKAAKNVLLSANLQELDRANDIKTLNTVEAKKLLAYIENLLSKTSEISISLASMPTNDERNELITWLRSKFGAQLMVHIIVQPELLAGCTVRTSTKLFDLSLNTALSTNTEKLVSRLEHV